MWLLNVHTRKLEHFEGSNIPNYAILSHRWEEDEVTFQDIQRGRGTDKRGYRKIDLCCRQAAGQLERARNGSYGLSYAWMDTCCIDKTNSAEVSEAINSMYKWYENSKVCYAYLSDVTANSGTASSSIERSAWFERGWTLQELLAPKLVIFYDSLWNDLGSKEELESEITEITGIPGTGLLYFDPQRKFNMEYKRDSVAEVMSWAARRTTTREEDQAYSLLGLFGVNMPLIYGEGKRAFLRLQEEILKLTADLTIFTWIAVGSDQQISSPFFASSPSVFGSSNKPAQRIFRKYREHDSLQAPAGPILTGEGLSIHLDLIPFRRNLYLAPICEYPIRDGYEPHGMMLRRQPNGLFSRYYGNEGKCLFKVPEIEPSWQLRTSTITLARRTTWLDDISYTDTDNNPFRAFEIDTSHLHCEATLFSLDETAQPNNRLNVAESHHGITDIVRLNLSETEPRYVLLGNDFEYRPFCLCISPNSVLRERSTPEVVQLSVPRLQMFGLTIGANSDMMPLVKELQAKKDQSWKVLTDKVELHFMPWGSLYAKFNLSSGEVLEFNRRDGVVRVTMKSSVSLVGRIESPGSRVIDRWHEHRTTSQRERACA